MVQLQEDKAVKQLPKNYMTNHLQIFDCVNFTKIKSNTTYKLSVPPLQSPDDYLLWTNIQRDIILSIIKDHFTIIHFDKHLQQTLTLEQLDNQIGTLYPFIKDSDGDCFIEIMPNDIRLLTEIINNDLIWDCGNLSHIAIFTDKPNLTDCGIPFKNAEVVMHSFYDNMGFYLDIYNTSVYSNLIEKKIESILNGYHITIKEES